jgi:hypothetical protein
MLSVRPFLRKLGIVVLHVSVAYLAVFVCLAYIVPVIKVPELVAFAIVCFSFPVMVLGILYVMYDGYAEIPFVIWFGLGMLFLAGTTLTLAILLS